MIPFCYFLETKPAFHDVIIRNEYNLDDFHNVRNNFIRFQTLFMRSDMISDRMFEFSCLIFRDSTGSVTYFLECPKQLMCFFL